MDSKLTHNQELFAQKVAEGLNQSDAYRFSYPASKNHSDKTVWENASKLAANAKVAPRIRELRALAAEKAVMTTADVLIEAMRIARFDVRKLFDERGALKPISEIDEETAAAIQSIEVFEEYAGQGASRVLIGRTKRYKMADKNAALEKLFKHFGLYETDNKQKTDPVLSLIKSLSGNVVGPANNE